MMDEQPTRVMMTSPEEVEEFKQRAVEDALRKLRQPIPPHLVEKLPKPRWKGAWDGQKAQHCGECGGYHPLSNTLHLLFAGHALITSMLLEADPFWSIEPLAFDDRGLPQLDQFGGMWCRITICGVSRICYGDAAGKPPGSTAIKEILGDCIRNGAMRYGLGLELWSHADIYEQKNPNTEGTNTDGTTQRAAGRAANGGGGGRSGAAGDRQQGTVNSDAAAPAPRAVNQDALDSLGEVCDEQGLDRRTMRDEYKRWVSRPETTLVGAVGTDLLLAHPDDVLAFAANLIAQASVEPDGGSGTEGGDSPAAGTTATESIF